MDPLLFCIANFLFIYPYFWAALKYLNYTLWHLSNLDSIVIIVLIIMLQKLLSNDITINVLAKQTQLSIMTIVLYYLILLVDKIFFHLIPNNEINIIVVILLIIEICCNINRIIQLKKEFLASK